MSRLCCASQISLKILLLFSLAIFSSAVYAQDEIDSELDEVEAYLDDEEKKLNEKSKRKRKPKELHAISDLATLAPFEDVAVIQKKFFPKTKRFELFAGASAQMNDAFFLNAGGIARLSYYFTEKWGLELSGLFLANGDRKVTQDLDEQGIVTSSIVRPKSYYGLDIKWAPIYGKMAFFDKKIVPFDLYFTLGAGLTQVEQSGRTNSETTLHLGTGQNFAINRWIAFRWDFSWNFFKPEVDSSQASNASGTFNNLFITLGFSFFFPSAEGR